MRKKEKEKEKLEKWMRANENIIRCFSLASKVSVNSYGTEGGNFWSQRPNLFPPLRGTKRTEKLRMVFFSFSSSSSPTWSGSSDSTGPTESRRSQMGTRWKRPAGPSKLNFVEGDVISTNYSIVLLLPLQQHNLFHFKRRPSRVARVKQECESECE